MTETIDIVALVQNNPLTKLHSDYGSKIIQKIQQCFSPEIQQLYIANCYCYLNFNSKTDFPVILDNIWKWMGYGRIEECKRCLIKNFKLDIDYKIEKAAPQDAGAGPKLSEEGKNLGGAGMNREYITLTINCFKKLCLKSKTTKADQIHEYYVELEDLMNELVVEQATELQMKLQDKDKQLRLKDIENKDTIIDNFKNKQVVYLIQVEEFVITYGFTNDIQRRLGEHRTEFGKDIIIKTVFETMIEKDLIIKPYIFSKVYKTNQTELIQLSDKFTYKHLKKQVDALKLNLTDELVPNLIDRIKELENQLLIKNKEEIIEKVTEEKEVIIKESNQQLS